MKVLFLADNEPVRQMFQAIADKLCYQSVMATPSLEAIEMEHPDVVVVAREETTPLEHKIVDCGVPTLLVPHGLPMPNERQLWSNGGKYLRFSHVCRLIKQGYWGIKTRRLPICQLVKTGIFRLKNDFRDGHTLSKYNGYSKIAAYGEGMRDTLLKYDVKPENIVVTGNPKYGKYLGVEQHKSKKVLVITDYLVEFGLWSKKQRVGWLRDVCDAAYKLTGKKAEILIHPVLEKTGEYERLVGQHTVPANVHQMELVELIRGCDVAVTLLSTSGLEMMVAGKPLVVYNPYGNPTLYGEDSGAYITHTKEELRKVFGELLKDGMSEDKKVLADAFVYRQTYLRDGKAAERIAGLIVEMAGGKRC